MRSLDAPHAVSFDQMQEAPPEGAVTLPVGIGRALLAVWALALAVGLVWSIFNAYGQFFLFGAAASIAVTIPLARAGYAIFSPWTLIAVVVYVGGGVRGFFISLGIDGTRSIGDLFLLGQAPSYFVSPSLLYVAAVALMAAVYSTSARVVPSRLMASLQRAEIPRLIPLVIATLALIGFVGFLLYASRTGGLSLGSISSKRTTISGLELDSSYRSYGALRLLASFSATAFWLHAAIMAILPKVRVGDFAKSGLLGLNAVLLPFYSSSRSQLVFTVITACAIFFAVRGKLPRARPVVGALLVVLTVVGFMTSARGQDSSASPATATSVTDNIGGVFVYNRNFGDMQTTSHIINAVPERLSFQYGGTIATWLVAPIPRELWPDKPIIKSGPLIGSVVYGNARSGVPPGFVAEMYWNGGIFGVLLGAVLLALVLGAVRNRFAGHLVGNPIGGFVYISIYFSLGINIMNGGVGSGIFNSIQAAAVVLFAVLLVYAVRNSGGRVVSRERRR